MVGALPVSGEGEREIVLLLSLEAGELGDDLADTMGVVVVIIVGGDDGVDRMGLEVGKKVSFDDLLTKGCIESTTRKSIVVVCQVS